MLYIVCAVIYFGVVNGNENTTVTENTTIATETLKEETRRNVLEFFDTTPFANPVKTYYRDIENHMKKMGINKTSGDLVYQVGPLAYDYPEIWWTTTTTEGKTFATEKATTTTDRTTQTEFITEKSTIQSDITIQERTAKPPVKYYRQFRVNNYELKPYIMKKPKQTKTKTRHTRKGVNNKKRVITKTSLARTQTTAHDYIFVVQRDDDNGIMSVESNDTAIGLEMKRFGGTGLHVAVTEAYLVNKDIDFNDVDWVVYKKHGRNGTQGGEGDDYYDDFSSREVEKGNQLLIKVLKPEEKNEALDRLRKGGKVIVGPDALSHIAKEDQQRLFNKYKITETTRANISTSQMPKQRQFVQNQNMNPNFPRMPPSQMNLNPNFYGRQQRPFSGNPMNQNPNFFRNPMNRNPNPYMNQNMNRNPFQQNNNVIRNYQNNGNLVRNQYPPNPNFNRNPNANFYNPNFNRYPQQLQYNQNPNVFPPPPPPPFRQNQNFQPPMRYQNPQNPYNPINPPYPPNANFGNPAMNPNFNRYPPQHINQNPIPNPYRNPFKQNSKAKQSFRPIQDQNTNPVTTQSITTELTKNANIEDTNATITNETTVAINRDNTQASINFEDHLPTIKTKIPYVELGVITTTAATTTEAWVPVTPTIPLYTPFLPPTSVVTMKGGYGPPTITTKFPIQQIKVTLSPYVQELVNIRTKLKAGFFSAAMAGIFDCLANKSKGHLSILVDRWEKEFDNLNNIDKIFEFGKPIHDALYDLTKALHTTPIDALQELMKVLHQAMLTRKQTLTQDLNSIIDYIDTMYTPEDGLALLKAVEKIKNYKSNATPNAETVLREFSKAILHPTIRYHNKAKEKILFDSINQFILNHKQTPLGPRRRNIKLHKLDDEQKKILEFKKKYMLNHSNKTKTSATSSLNIRAKAKPSKKKTITKTSGTSTSAKTTLQKPMRQQRYQVKSKLKQRASNKTKSKTEDVTLKVTTVTEKLTTEGVPSNQSKHKIIHPRKKVSIAKLLRLKIEHPKLYKKYFKRKKKNHYKKQKQHKRSRGKHSKHKLSKKDKLLLKYKVMELEYQKLLNKLKAAKHKQKSNKKTTNVTPPNNYVDIKKLMEEFINEKFPVTKKRTSSRHENVSDNPTTETKIQQWQTVKKDLSHFVPFSIDPITQNPDVLSQKFNVFNQDLARKRNKLMNLLAGSSDYSDEENIIRLNIDDALKLNNKVNARRQNTEEALDTIHKINKYSSYSSEEVLLKSKIYKGFVFNDFSESNSEELAEEDKKVLKNTVKKLLTRRSFVKPINEASSYSDDEEIIRKKLNI